MPKKTSFESNTKVCEKCGDRSPVEADACVSCSGTRFAPDWVKELRRVNRQVAVQITTPTAVGGEQAADRITLYKWWPGGRATFNVPNADQWQRIRDIVDFELAPLLGWRTGEEVGQAMAALARSERRDAKQVKALTKGDPTFITKLLKSIDLSKVDHADFAQLGDALGEIASVYVNADVGLQRSIRALVKELPAQGQAAIDQLAELMETLTLSQITAVTSEVQRRMGLLDTFRQRINDERTYEISGAGSIHRLLEQAMWIIDDRYWLMHSNEQLRKVVGDEIEKRHKSKKLKRPDFVCGTVDNRLIVIEIKRPSHKLKIEDLNQLEEYIRLMGEYQAYSGFEATLVGKSVPDDVRKTLTFRSRSFKAISYTQLLGDAERRYSEYLKALASTS